MDTKPFKSHKENEKADLEARKLADVAYVGARKRKGRLSRRGYISCSMDRKKGISSITRKCSQKIMPINHF